MRREEDDSEKQARIVSLEALGHKDCERPSVGSKKHLKRQPGFGFAEPKAGEPLTKENPPRD